MDPQVLSQPRSTQVSKTCAGIIKLADQLKEAAQHHQKKPLPAGQIDASMDSVESIQQSLDATNRELEAAIFKAKQMAADAEIRSYQLEKEIERRKSMEKELRISEEKYRSIIENIEEGYFETDLPGRFLFVNDAMADLLGHSCEALLNMSSLALVDEASKEEVMESFKRVFRSDESLSACGFAVRHPDGTKRHLETSVALIRDAEGRKKGFRGIVRDVEQRKKYEEKLVYLAYHDALTGISNRKAFYERLEEGLAYARRYQTEIALVFIDIDKFKQVNDTLGHEIGDALLIEIARRLQGCVRETDFLCRIGGDEFTVILNNPKQANPEIVARRIVEKIATPYTLNDILIDYVSASIGISRFPNDADNAEDLVKTADTAMYKAKENRNCYICYSA